MAQALGNEFAYPPRGLCLEEAAAYVGVSPNTFAEEVKNRRLPEPLRLGRRRIWDKKALDAWLDGLSKLTNDKMGRWGDVGQNALRRQKT